jgi:hypothetical protein
VLRSAVGLKLRLMAVTFDVAGRTYALADPQATILAENLRILSKSELASTSEPAALLGTDGDWRGGAEALADAIEAALVADDPAPLHLEGGAADATYCVLRLMVGLDMNAATGLRDALGAPVPAPEAVAAPLGGEPPRHLSRPELVELLVVLFALAVLTVILAIAWTGTWWVIAPIIAILLGIRVAKTRATGRLAWSIASLVWWGIFLVPAAVLVTLVGLLVLAILKH